MEYFFLWSEQREHVGCMDCLVWRVCSRQWSESAHVEKGRYWPSLHSTVLRSTYPAHLPLRQSTNLRPWPKLPLIVLCVQLAATKASGAMSKNGNKTAQRSRRHFHRNCVANLFNWLHNLLNWLHNLLNLLYNLLNILLTLRTTHLIYCTTCLIYCTTCFVLQGQQEVQQETGRLCSRRANSKQVCNVDACTAI